MSRESALAWAEWSPFFLEVDVRLKGEAPEQQKKQKPKGGEDEGVFVSALLAAEKKDKGKARATDTEEKPSQQQPERKRENVDDAWVRTKCREFLKGSALALDVGNAVLSTLASPKSDAEIQSEILDLLGTFTPETFDFVSVLLSGRKSLQEWRRRESKKQKPKPKTVSELIAESSGADTVVPEKPQSILARLIENATAEPTKALPEGTKRFTHQTYDEVTVPPVIPKVVGEQELVPVSAFDDWAQLAFEGYTHLNRVQSRLFEAAYHGNGNLLICSPTGSGKTNVALMAILHEISQHVHGGILRKGDFKIIYVAPLKGESTNLQHFERPPPPLFGDLTRRTALAQEITRNFERRLKPLSISVKELTGDMQLTKREIGETQVIVTTPEKWDVITRKSNDSALAQLVRLLIIDEVHLLHEDRGPVIETLVARTLRLVEKTQTQIRIVGLSATLPNYADVAAFLRADPGTGIFFFDASYRPVPLSMRFIGVKEPNQQKQKVVMNEICYDRVAESLRKGHQVMVFVHARKETVVTSQKLIDIAQVKVFFLFIHLFAKQQQTTNKRNPGIAGALPREAGLSGSEEFRPSGQQVAQQGAPRPLRERFLDSPRWDAAPGPHARRASLCCWCDQGARLHSDPCLGCESPFPQISPHTT